MFVLAIIISSCFVCGVFSFRIIKHDTYTHTCRSMFPRRESHLGFSSKKYLKLHHSIARGRVPENLLLMSKLASSDIPIDDLKRKPSILFRNTLKTIFGLGTLFLINSSSSKMLKYFNISFPASLAAMIAVFTIMIIIGNNDDKIAASVLNTFLPAMAFIKAWLPLFFVPPLVVIPLKFHLLHGKVFQLLSVIIIGGVLSLTSTAYIGRWTASSAPSPVNRTKENKSVNKVSPSDPRPTSSLPSPRIPILVVISIFSFEIMMKSRNPLVKRVLGVSLGASSTIGSYLIATHWTSAAMKKIAHPAIICALLSTLVQYAWGLVTNQSFASLLSSYYGNGNGAGDIVSAFLGPSIITFGFQLYQQKSLLFSNTSRVVLTSLFSAFFGLFSSSLLSRIFRLGIPEVALSSLTRCITTPLALAGAKLTLADPSLSALAVVISGLLGASFGKAWLSFLGFKEKEDDITVGLAIGASAHGLGSASLVNEPIQFASSIVAMTLTGLFTIVLLSIKPLKHLLISIATNGFKPL